MTTFCSSSTTSRWAPARTPRCECPRGFGADGHGPLHQPGESCPGRRPVPRDDTLGRRRPHDLSAWAGQRRPLAPSASGLRWPRHSPGPDVVSASRTGLWSSSRSPTVAEPSHDGDGDESVRWKTYPRGSTWRHSWPSMHLGRRGRPPGNRGKSDWGRRPVGRDPLVGSDARRKSARRQDQRDRVGRPRCRSWSVKRHAPDVASCAFPMTCTPRRHWIWREDPGWSRSTTSKGWG